MTTTISHHRDMARKHCAEEFARTIHQLEETLHQLQYHWQGFNDGDDKEKAERAGNAIQLIRRMSSSINIGALADEAARLEILAEIDQ